MLHTHGQQVLYLFVIARVHHRVRCVLGLPAPTPKQVHIGLTAGVHDAAGPVGAHVLGSDHSGNGCGSVVRHCAVVEQHLFETDGQTRCGGGAECVIQKAQRVAGKRLALGRIAPAVPHGGRNGLCVLDGHAVHSDI